MENWLVQHTRPLLAGCGWLLTAALLTGCHPISQYISPRVEGRVVDAQTHEPLANTRVQKVSRKQNLNPSEPPKGGQLLTQHNGVFTTTDGSFVIDSQKAVGVFRSLFWYSVNLSFQHAGYLQFTTNYTPANATNLLSGEPVVRTGDILLVPLSSETPTTNSPASTNANLQINPIKE